jgi:predicted nucleic acid-binding protein
MPVVVDASVAIKWIVAEGELDAQALALRDGADGIEAPDLILPELANTMWKKWRRGAMTRADAENGMDAIRNYFVIHSSTDLYQRAMALSIELDHPAYDCFYLACAEAAASILITADRALCDVTTRAGLGHLVHHLADVPI